MQSGHDAAGLGAVPAHALHLVLEYSSTAAEYDPHWMNGTPSDEDKRNLWEERNAAVNPLALVASQWWHALTACGVAPTLRRCVTSLPVLPDVAGCRLIDRLQVLNLSGCEITDVSLTAVAKHCSALQHLDICGCRKVSDVGVEAVALHCASLQYLDVAGIDADEVRTEGECARHYYNARMRRITDVALDALARHCTGLRHLNMNGSFITDAGLEAAAPYCSALQHLNVSCCDFVTALCLNAVAGCSGLQLLNASYVKKGITDSDLEAALTQDCLGLQHLSVCGWRDVTSTGLGVLLQHFPRLQYLHAYGTAISENGLEVVAMRSPRLDVNTSMDHPDS